MSKDRKRPYSFLFFGRMTRLRRKVRARRTIEMEIVYDMLSIANKAMTPNRYCARLLKQKGFNVEYKQRYWIIT